MKIAINFKFLTIIENYAIIKPNWRYQMLELLALIILIAIFFGISLSAALNGVIIIFVSILAGWFLLALLFPPFADLFEWNQDRKKKQAIANQARRKEAQAKRAAKKAAKQNKYPWAGAIIVFVFMYLVTALFIILVGLIIRNFIPNMTFNIPEWLMLLLPATPFVAFEIIACIKNRARR